MFVVLAGDDVEHARRAASRRCAARRGWSPAASMGGGLTIAVLPASSACGRAAPRIAIGQLNGTMTVTTPSGWYDDGRLDRDAGHDGEHLAGVDLVGEHQRQVPADLEDERVDPGLEADLAVLLRQDGGVLVARRRRCPRSRRHLLGALGGATAPTTPGTRPSPRRRVVHVLRRSRLPRVRRSRPACPGRRCRGSSSVCRSSPPMYRPVRTSAAVAHGVRHWSHLSVRFSGFRVGGWIGRRVLIRQALSFHHRLANRAGRFCLETRICSARS